MSSKILVPNFFGEAYPVLLPTATLLDLHKKKPLHLLNQRDLCFLFYLFPFLLFTLVNYYLFPMKKSFKVNLQPCRRQAGGERSFKPLSAAVTSIYTFAHSGQAFILILTLIASQSLCFPNDPDVQHSGQPSLITDSLDRGGGGSLG